MEIEKFVFPLCTAVECVHPRGIEKRKSVRPSKKLKPQGRFMFCTPRALLHLKLM
jgi:hypothetical protein